MKLILLFSAALYAVEPAKPTPPPVIPDSLRADFWYIDGQLARLQKDLVAVQEKMAAACGPNHFAAANEPPKITCLPKLPVEPAKGTP